MTKRKRENLAVTAGGARYNKLQRPDTLTAPPTQAPQYDDEPYHKLSRSDAPSKQEPENGEEDVGEQDEEPSGSDVRYSNRQPRPDATSGQRSFLPGLDDSVDEDADTHEALSYLRSVRTEAADIPNLLVAPKPSIPEGQYDPSLYDTGYGDSRGYYSDGAYVAAPPLGPVLPPSARPSASRAPISPQSAYHARLLARFHHQRAILHKTPPADAFGSLEPTQFISLPKGNKAAFREWRTSLETSPPSPAQLAAMSTGTVLRVLGLVTSFLRRDRNIPKRVSAWVWGLLARLPDVGTLGSEEVGVVRALGKRAVWVKCGFMSREIAKQTEAFGGEADEEYVERRPRYEVERSRIEAGRYSDGNESEDERSSSSPPETSEEEASRRRNSSSPLPEVVDMSVAEALGLDNPKLAPELRASRERIRDIYERVNGSPPLVAVQGDDIRIYHPTVGEIVVRRELSISELQLPLKDDAGDEAADHRRDNLNPYSPYQKGTNMSLAAALEIDDPSLTPEQLESRKQILSAYSHFSPPPPAVSRQGGGIRIYTPALGAIVLKERTFDEYLIQVEKVNEKEKWEEEDEGVYDESEAERVQDEEHDGAGKDEGMEEAAESAETKGREAGNGEDEEVPDTNTKATLDMIITIAAELYGQRDLLEFREVWAAASDADEDGT